MRSDDGAAHQVACHFPLSAVPRHDQRGGHGTPAPAGRCRLGKPVKPVSKPGGEERGHVSIAEGVQGRSLPDDRELSAASRIEGRSPWALAWQRLRHDRVAIGSAVVIFLISLMAICAPLIAKAVGHGPNQQFPTTGLTIAGLPRPPSRTFLFGTDDLGRDVLGPGGLRARISLLVGVAATGLAVLLGRRSRHRRGLLRRPHGLLAGPADGRRAVLPSAAVRHRPGGHRRPEPAGHHPRHRLFLLGARGPGGQGPDVGAQGTRVRRSGSLSRGQQHAHHVRGHPPNLAAPIIVYATLLVPAAIAFEATLSFLGLGILPPTAEWGNMLAEAVGYYQVAWWFLVFPGAALIITTLAFNLLGDAVRDALDPRAGALFGVRSEAPPLTVGIED